MNILCRKYFSELMTQIIFHQYFNIALYSIFTKRIISVYRVMLSMNDSAKNWGNQIKSSYLTTCVCIYLMFSCWYFGVCVAVILSKSILGKVLYFSHKMVFLWRIPWFVGSRQHKSIMLQWINQWNKRQKGIEFVQFVCDSLRFFFPIVLLPFIERSTSFFCSCDLVQLQLACFCRINHFKFNYTLCTQIYIFRAMSLALQRNLLR